MEISLEVKKLHIIGVAWFKINTLANIININYLCSLNSFVISFKIIRDSPKGVIP